MLSEREMASIGKEDAEKSFTLRYSSAAVRLSRWFRLALEGPGNLSSGWMIVFARRSSPSPPSLELPVGQARW